MEGEFAAETGERWPERRTLPRAAPTFAPGGLTLPLPKATLTRTTLPHTRGPTLARANVALGATLARRGLTFAQGLAGSNPCPTLGPTLPRRGNVNPRRGNVRKNPSIQVAPGYALCPAISQHFIHSLLLAALFSLPLLVCCPVPLISPKSLSNVRPDLSTGFKSSALTTRPSQLLK